MLILKPSKCELRSTRRSTNSPTFCSTVVMFSSSILSYMLKDGIKRAGDVQALPWWAPMPIFCRLSWLLLGCWKLDVQRLQRHASLSSVRMVFRCLYHRHETVARLLRSQIGQSSIPNGYVWKTGWSIRRKDHKRSTPDPNVRRSNEAIRTQVTQAHRSDASLISKL